MILSETNMNLTEASSLFLSYCKQTKKLSGHTLRAYSRDLECFKNFSEHNIDIENCDRTHLRNYLHHLFETCELKESSAKRRFACLNAMFSWLESEELITETPFRKLQLSIRLPARLPRGLNKREIRRLLNSPTQLLGYSHQDDLTKEDCTRISRNTWEFRQLITLISLNLLFATGIRVAELVAIRHKDVDLQEKTIRIHGKGDRERLVFLPGKSLLKLLQLYLGAKRNIVQSTEHLMITTRGTVATTQYIRLLVARAGENAKLDRRITPHMLRHSAATQLLNNGTDIRFVQRLLGHQSITTTQIYTQVGDATLKQVINKKHPMEKIMTR